MLDDWNEDDPSHGYELEAGASAVKAGGPPSAPNAQTLKLGPGPHWTSTRMTRILRRTSVTSSQQGFTISSWRHLSIAFTRRYFRTGTTAHARLVDEVDEGYGSGDEYDNEDQDDSIWDRQACHSSLTAGLVYGRLMIEGCFETNERRVNFQSISEEWHRLLGFPSAVAGFGEVLRPGHKRKTPSLHHEAMHQLQMARWKMLRRINTEHELRRLHGDQIRFRGRQREAIDAIMQNKSPVVVVMGTGQGKSLCFMLPAASCPGELTVVIVPLVSLLGDMMDRC